MMSHRITLSCVGLIALFALGSLSLASAALPPFQIELKFYGQNNEGTATCAVDVDSAPKNITAWKCKFCTLAACIGGKYGTLASPPSALNTTGTRSLYSYTIGSNDDSQPIPPWGSFFASYGMFSNAIASANLVLAYDSSTQKWSCDKCNVYIYTTGTPTNLIATFKYKLDTAVTRQRGIGQK